MSEGCSPELMTKHSEQLGKHDKAIDSLREDVNRHEDAIANAIESLATNQAEQSKIQTKILVNIEKQNTSIEKQGLVTEHLVKDVDYLKKNAETTGTVERLHGRVEEIEGLYKADKEKEQQDRIQEFEDMKKFITKILVGAIVFVITALLVFAVVMLWGIAQAGLLPQEPPTEVSLQILDYMV